MAVDLGSLELYMGPSHIGAPDDLVDTILKVIDGATKTLDIAVQELDSETIARSIVSAKQRGVSVRIVLERDYLMEKNGVTDPWVSDGRLVENRTILAALLRAGVPVVIDLNPDIFHQKFIVADYDVSSSRAVVLTGSTNFTTTGTTRNLNHIVIMRGKRIAGQYHDEFEEIYSGTFGQKRERHEKHPQEIGIAKVRVKVLFAPDHAPEMEIMKQMLKAKNRVDFAVFTFANSSGIDDTMIALHKAGIQVRGVMASLSSGTSWAATHGLLSAGIELHRANPGGGLNLLHHKLMVLDEQVVIAGSFNYTNPATMLNDENIVIIGDLDEDDPDAIDRQKQLASFALAEIDRIIDVHGERL